MKAYLHFTPGDALLFDTIAPSSPGGVFAACLALFLIAVGERSLLAFSRRFAKVRVSRSQRLIQTYGFASASEVDVKLAGSDQSTYPTRTPFILTHELSRGVLAGLQTTVHYLLMLVVMTFNAAFIISVILGVAVGEVAFGRLYR
ncbi:Ctr copper transporter [Mycena amicta]|nr:Ctr copper transporter [Mycena amicta]